MKTVLCAWISIKKLFVCDWKVAFDASFGDLRKSLRTDHQHNRIKLLNKTHPKTSDPRAPGLHLSRLDFRIYFHIQIYEHCRIIRFVLKSNLLSNDDRAENTYLAVRSIGSVNNYREAKEVLEDNQRFKESTVKWSSEHLVFRWRLTIEIPPLTSSFKFFNWFEAWSKQKRKHRWPTSTKKW